LTPRFSYSKAGVDRKVRAESKKALEALRQTYAFSRYGKIVQLPYGNILPFHDRFLDLVIEGVGTKVLVAQLAERFDTVGIDGVAMAVNDVIRSGARPLAVADNIHAHVSDPALVREWMKGIVKGAVEAECTVPSGEIGDVAELIKGVFEGKGFDMVFASVGEVEEPRIIYGRNVVPGDVVVGMRSSGVHSNGITLARKVLFSKWGGKYAPHDVPDGLEREVVLEVLEPTRIYVKPLLNVAERVEVKAAVHVTGDAYLKFNRLAEFSKGIGFEFSVFSPQPIFEVIQRTAAELGWTITDEEMFNTFNMGWGFAVIVGENDADDAIAAAGRAGVDAERIGHIVGGNGVRVFHKGRKLILG